MQSQLLSGPHRLRGSVLVVDDDDGVRRVLTRWASDLGYQVSAAADATEALEMMRRETVDVALCDVKMPGRDGVWLIDQLRRNYPFTSIVLATGMTEMDPMVTLRSGVVGYIVKPFNRGELDDVIQRGLAACSERSRVRPERRALPAPPADAGIVEGVVVARHY
jgi:CheY-like chemotaxis protein